MAIIDHFPVSDSDSVCLVGQCTCEKEQEARTLGPRVIPPRPVAPRTMIGPPPEGFRQPNESSYTTGVQPQRETVTDQEAADVEVRTTSSTGGQKGTKLARFDLLPVGPLTELAKHYGRGAAKYDDNNWRKGYEWSKSYAAAQRHLTAFWGGEDIDEETGTPHVIAAAWHCFALAENMDAFPEFDDRFKRNTE